MKKQKLPRLAGVLLWLAASIPASAVSTDDLISIEEYGLRLAPGFSISLHADSDLASDIYAMTLNSKGEAVVTSRGYIKTLHDTDNDGKADRATIFAETPTGGMGLCFDGDDLLFVGDGALWRYRDRDGDGRADGAPEKLLPAAFAEHGGHAIRRGPDGYWYLIGGNDSGLIQQVAGTAHPQNPKPEAGALIRLSPDFKTRQLFAHGFRNPYDFDFNAMGEIFTYDADGEREFLLPWYTPTRIFHVQRGAHHGWRLDGYQRSWSLPDYYTDVTDILAPIGRGSPTGVTVYRHTRFPARYYNGLFALDWTFGRIWFLPLRANGANYRAEPEVFLEPLGSQGFAPNDICVTPDGALLVSIGGRKTRGAVFRIDTATASSSRRNSGKPQPPDNILDDEKAALDFVLSAPQPLDAWSRALWLPLAQQLGEMPLKRAVVDEKRSATQRVRAVEIVTELFGGLETPRAIIASQDPSSLLRARVAWSLGIKPCEGVEPILLKLATDAHSLVRRCALEALQEQFPKVDPAELAQALAPNFAYRDQRVRHAAIQIASLLPEKNWNELQTQATKAGQQPELSAVLGELWRWDGRSLAYDSLMRVAAILERTFNTELRQQALRLAFMALGDFNIHRPSVEVYAAFETIFDLTSQPELRKRLAEAVLEHYPSGDATLDRESARLLAVLRYESPEAARKTASLIRAESSPVDDVHYLVALSRLPGFRDAGMAPVIARRIVQLDQKLAGQHLRGKQNWAPRLAEAVAGLSAQDPQFADELIKLPNFAAAGHVEMALAFDGERQARAAQAFKKAVENNLDFRWETSLVSLLGKLPASEAHPLLRRQWSNHGLRDEIVLQLAREPRLEDEEKFLVGLSSPRNDVVQASLAALLVLPRQADLEKWRPLVRLLDRLIKDPPQKELRAQAVMLLNRNAEQRFSSDETKARTPAEAYAPVFRWLRDTHPELLGTKEETQEQDANEWQQLLRTLPSQSGNAKRGAELFHQRACESCHGGGPSLGPDLSGAANRFSTEDLLTAIVWPSRDIAPAYRGTIFVMKNGEVHTGIVSFESADGVILQTGPGISVRLADNDIAERKPSDVSLMPTGLLKGLNASDVADLYAFLKTLK